MSPTRTRTREPDQACAEAVDLALDAVVAVVGAAQVGDHLGVQAEGERIVTHLFDCADPAYAGWRWAVTVVRAPRAKVVTVSETVLLPGPGALLAPDWVPWHDRLRPGDLGVGDLLPAPPDDERLVSLVVLEGEDAVTDWFDGERGRGGRGTRRAGRAARARTVARAVGHRPGRRVRALVRQRARPADAARARGARPLRQLRLLRAAERGARPSLRRLRERVRAGRRPGRVGRSRLRSSLGVHGRRGGRAGVAPVIDEFGYDLVDLPGVSVEETVFEPLSRGAD